MLRHGSEPDLHKIHNFQDINQNILQLGKSIKLDDLESVVYLRKKEFFTNFSFNLPQYKNPLQ